MRAVAAGRAGDTALSAKTETAPHEGDRGSGGRYQTCIALAEEAPAAPTVLLDCGATTMTALREQRIDPNEIRTVLVSHLHGDHFGGLPFLVLDGRFRRRTEDLTVIGPPCMATTSADCRSSSSTDGSAAAPRTSR
jgi:ribonuclease BN (tRNA processing enzyme)